MLNPSVQIPFQLIHLKENVVLYVQVGYDIEGVFNTMGLLQYII